MGYKCCKKRLLFLIPVVLVILTGALVWYGIRASSTVACQAGTELSPSPYSQQEQVMKAVSLSFLVYGCEGCDDLSGTVSELLAENQMGIITENFGIKRTNPEDPASALFDSAEFIRENAGDFRYLTSVCDRKSGFYGAAFCDDANGCVWIAYSGSVSIEDAIACAELVFAPGLSSQERSAFELYEKTMDSREVKELAYSVILTGHSLGGAFASMVSRASGCTAVTVNGADGLAVDKINGILGSRPETYHITNYMTSPDNGKFSFMDLVQRLVFLGSCKAVKYFLFEENGLTEDTHCAFSFIRFADDQFLIPELPEPIESSLPLSPA